MANIELSPIGHVECDQVYRFEAPRQSTLAANTGCIELMPDQNFEHALVDLDGFDRIWVIYNFHLNSTWKPKVNPPRTTTRKKVGVFATRSPHRPNQIGMSCVELVRVEGRRVYIKNFDILQGTPVLDIKPYIPYCDSFPGSATGWIPEDIPADYSVEIDDITKAKADYIYQISSLNLIVFAESQLEHDPFSSRRKRITKAVDDEYFWLGCRTWKILFTVEDKMIVLKDICSSYSNEEIDCDEDKYGDKEYHRQFRRFVNSTYPK